MALHGTNANRPFLTYPEKGIFTQGLIFSGGYAPGYETCESYGVSITARCDAANDKADTYNYLPIISLDDWIHRDGTNIIGNRLKDDALEALAKTLENNNYSRSVLDTEAPSDIINALFPEDTKDKKALSERAKAIKAVDKYNLACRTLSSHPEDKTCLEVKDQYSSVVSAALKDLINNKLSGYYFLPNIEIGGETRGYIALLREVQALPKELVQLVLAGITTSSYLDACDKRPTFRGRLRLGDNSIAMPLSVLNSPNIEHLLQTFAMLFSRIGVRDTPKAYIDSIWDRQPSLMEQKS